jgi:hypothetical protein
LEMLDAAVSGRALLVAVMGRDDPGRLLVPLRRRDVGRSLAEMAVIGVADGAPAGVSGVDVNATLRGPGTSPMVGRAGFDIGNGG